LLLTPNGLVLASRSDAEQQKSRVLSAADQALIEEIADTLLPTTRSSPGAKCVTTTSELGGENGKRFRGTESGSCGLPA
jgi:hypothetical protein